MNPPYTIRYREDGPGTPRVYPVAIERHGYTVLHLVPSERTMEHAEEVVSLWREAALRAEEADTEIAKLNARVAELEAELEGAAGLCRRIAELEFDLDEIRARAASDKGVLRHEIKMLKGKLELAEAKIKSQRLVIDELERNQ